MKTETLPERLEVKEPGRLFDPTEQMTVANVVEYPHSGFAAELAHRYNVHRGLVEALMTALDSNVVQIEASHIADRLRKALASAERKHES